MRSLIALASLTFGLLCPVVLTTPAFAVGESCNGLAATMVGSAGATVIGTDAADVIVSNGAAFVNGAGGDDVICTTNSVPRPGDDDAVTVIGGAGNDLIDRRGDISPGAYGTLFGESGRDTIYGSSAGEFVRVAGTMPDHVQTFGGDDSMISAGVGQRSDPDTIDLGAGNDDFTTSRPFSRHLSVDGGEGEDLMSLALPGDGPLTIDAADGRLRPGAGALRFGGFESYSVQVSQDRGQPPISVSFVGSDVGESFTSNADRVTAKMAGGADTIHMVESNQLVTAAAGAGRDTVAVSASDDASLVVDLQGGRVRGTTGYDTGFGGSIRSVEDAELIAGSVRVVGSASDNAVTVASCRRAVVEAGAGDDDVIMLRTTRRLCDPGGAPRAYGGPGNDTLIGSDVADVLDGGSGNDEADGGEDRDTCVSIEVRTSCERQA